METPISCDGKLIVDRKYIEYVCRKANSKFGENFDRINRLHDNLKTNCFQLSKDGSNNVKAKDLKKSEKAQMRLEKREYYQKLKQSGELMNGNDRNNNNGQNQNRCQEEIADCSLDSKDLLVQDVVE